MPSVPPPGRDADITDLMRASGMIGLKARRVTRTSEGGFVVLGGQLPDGRLRIVDPVTSVEAGYACGGSRGNGACGFRCGVFAGR